MHRQVAEAAPKRHLLLHRHVLIMEDENPVLGQGVVEGMHGGSIGRYSEIRPANFRTDIGL